MDLQNLMAKKKSGPGMRAAYFAAVFRDLKAPALSDGRGSFPRRSVKLVVGSCDGEPLG
jgi:hypothetical protein